MARALGVESLDEIGDRIAELLKPELPKGWGGFKDALGKVAQLRSAPPKTVRSGSCQDVVLTGDQVDLNLLPGIQAWPLDGHLREGSNCECCDEEKRQAQASHQSLSL